MDSAVSHEKDEKVGRLCDRVADMAARHPGAPVDHHQVSLLGEIVEGGPCCDGGWTELVDGRLVRCPAGHAPPAPRVRVARPARRDKGAAWVGR